MHKRKYSWKPDLPDNRDIYYGAVSKKLPSKIDLRPQMPEVYDQGQLGSCTGNAIAGAFQFEQRKQKLADFVPSRLFIYYNERKMEGTVNTDSGAQIRDGIKSINKQGVCPESNWPYQVRKFKTKPSAVCYKEALNNQLTSYQRIDNSKLNDLKTCLADGYPFVFGMTVYESFESDEVASSGIVPMPAHTEQMLGGHAVCCVGYDDAKKVFIVRNSWGANWGMSGYFTIPYDYVTNTDLCDDFWTLRVVE